MKQAYSTGAMAVKVFLVTIALAATIGGWAMFSTTGKPTVAGTTPMSTVIPPKQKSIELVLPEIPTVIPPPTDEPLALQPAVAHQPVVNQQPEPIATPKPVLRQVSAPAPVVVHATAPPAVVVTSSSQ